MTLRRLASDDGLPFFPSPSNKRITLKFPKTPNPPPDPDPDPKYPEVYSDAESDSDSE